MTTAEVKKQSLPKKGWKPYDVFEFEDARFGECLLAAAAYV
jgi:hypothetical protein